MRNTLYFKNKNILIVGFARSGLACANLLHSLGANVRVTDCKDTPAERENLAKLSSKEIKVELGGHTNDFVKGVDLMVISPGVPLNALPVVWAKELGVKVISEIEVASILCPAEIIAITGANGKTTVTTLIGKMLEKAGKNVFVCGNIGTPFCAEVGKLCEDDFVVLEVSSFQLETIDGFKPKVAMILNLTANHLDRYNNMQEYVAAKKRIFMNQDKDNFIVLNEEDSILKNIAGEPKSKVVFFHKANGLNQNQCAVLSVGEILGIKKDLILEVFKELRGIEHRMEEVADFRGIKFINDSKATTADSAIWAMSNINNPIVLIAGGRDKGIDYRVILQAAKGKLRKAILIGEAKQKIAQALGGDFPVEDAVSLEEAVKKAADFARAGDTVLLSPMCASYDMFKNYEERGRAFKRIVLDLVNSNR